MFRQTWRLKGWSSQPLGIDFHVAWIIRRLNFVGSYLSTIEAVRTGSWLSVVQVLLDVSIALLVAIIEFHGGIHRGYRTISSEFFFVKRYTQTHLKIRFIRTLGFSLILPGYYRLYLSSKDGNLTRRFHLANSHFRRPRWRRMAAVKRFRAKPMYLNS